MDRRGEGWVGVRGHRVGVAGIMPIFDVILAFRCHGAAADQARRCDLRDQPQDPRLDLPGGGRPAHNVRVLSAQQVAAGPVGGDRRRRDRVRQRYQVDAYHPIWSLTYIAIGVLVIYALAAHGGKAETR